MKEGALESSFPFLSKTPINDISLAHVELNLYGNQYNYFTT